MGNDIAITTQALAGHFRATAQLIATVRTIARDRYAVRASRPVALKLETALACPDLAPRRETCMGKELVA
ncbi:hypothetical protein LPB142_16940 (plasmid) [Rhodobacter xanthinilyticus]|uniref:Uncharacterized protein n=1 Tax=Rhodobacter xanthinilyticus TaxID=1850250 RepID=A0A1D9MHA1_9RHOB|nr:hypothetical protein [Rhodobacter xanthinilyticus]AOZ71173.1 hypothetical protein LPB142_16940 [Rhodobacter xanthinilyticus]